MDAVMYLKEFYRMCKTIDKCEKCPHSGSKTEIACDDLKFLDPEKSVKIVEKWSKENPVKTRVMDFFEKFPNAKKKQSGIPLVCIATLGYPDPCNDKCGCVYVDCEGCWNRPLEEVD